jgi:uridylate kinase
MKYNRILLKLSGEALMGDERYGIDPDTIQEVSAQVKDLNELGVEVAIVVGGGNIYRGMRAEAQGISRVTGDHMGMLATVINALALQGSLERIGISAQVLSAIAMDRVAGHHSRRKALECLENGMVVIFAGGTGEPFFTTDTTAALRAAEVEADAILKATKVDGVFDKDPELHNDATFFSEISYRDVLDRDLKVMDATAITLCRENDIPIIVFNMRGKDFMKKIVLGEQIGTIVRREP